MWKATIVTHSDLDGVGAAAVYLRLGGLVLGSDARLFFAEPYNLPRILSGIDTSTERLVVSDLGVNSSTLDALLSSLKRFTGKGVVVEWYDHHRWLGEWLDRLGDLGVRLHVDTSTCATGVVAKYAPLELGVEVDGFVEELVKAVCAADLWIWDHPLAPRLYRVVDKYKGARGDEWRRKIVRGFAEGSLWWPELEEALEDYIDAELKGFSKAFSTLVVEEYEGCRIGFVLKQPGPPSTGVLASSLMARKKLGVVVVVKTRNSSGLSLRSQKPFDVQKLAVAMGGGGHPRAAGAPLKLPWYARLLSKVYSRLKLRYAKKSVLGALRALGRCPLEG